MEISSNLVSSQNETTKNTETSKETTNTFNELLSEPKEEEETKAEKRQRLLADITSLFKTGLTVAELKVLEDMIAERKEKMKDEDVDESEMNSLLDDLEEAISTLKKEITGSSIIEAEDLENSNSSSSSFSSSITARLDTAQQNINTMIKTDDLSEYTQSEILEEILNFKEA